MGIFDFDFSTLFTLTNFLVIIIGTLVGLCIGALPGLGGIVGIVLLLPFTYNLSPIAAILLLLAAYQAGSYGGSISSIVLGIPGTPAAAATLLDGNTLAKKNSPGKALAYSLTASSIGGLTGGLVLLFLAVPLGHFALNFSSPEFFLIAAFSLMAVGGLSSADKTKSMISVVLGLMASTVGMDMFTGQPRFTFGQNGLMDGISIIALTVGMFAVAEIFSMIGEGMGRQHDGSSKGLSTKLSFKELKGILKVTFTGSSMGSALGTFPGIGADTAAWLSYSSAKKSSKNPESFGQGNPEGIAAPESANNAVVGSALIPLLTLAIPGSPSVAIIMGAFIIHGIQPGPKLFDTESQLVYGILIGFLFTTIAMYGIGRLLTPMFARILKVPNYILIPIIFILSITGVYISDSISFNVWFTIGAGVIFFLLIRLDFSLPSFILAFVLGPIMEENLRRALLVSDNGYFIFFTRPYSIAILIIIAVLFSFVLLSNRKKKRKTQENGRSV
ncbi:tripartite tricarboxylate transporter permease [Salibacterium aidingense]|uniref:tripartite tricarboxylate transporter permease n=1 Tax=Salibacterium aidingense TaxID=384933 RepID=UPI003BCDC56B